MDKRYRIIEKEVLSMVKKKEVELGEIIRQVSKSKKVREDEVARVIFNLRKSGKILIEDSSPPKSLLSYSLSLYSLWFWTATLIVAITGILIYAIPSKMPYLIARYIFGSVFVLYIPGYSLIEALYPKEEELKPIERLALSIGLSLALVPLVGLVLNYTPWGIRLTPIYYSLSLLTLFLLIVALVRKYEIHMLKLKIGEKVE